MNAIVPQNFGPMAARFQGVSQDNDLGAGVQAGFGLIGYRGKVWSIRYRGDERQLMRDDGDGPRGSIEVVILKASGAVSKIWYENGYTEGSHASPDCFSTNGVTPDLSSPKKQSNACASCPMNAWGSRITPAGKAGKACSDSKRLAIAPLGDIRNEVFGGPLLLRVPAASLQDLAQFGAMMHKMGYPYSSIGVRISFDPAESYPKFVFNAIRPLNDEEADIVLELQGSPQVDRILAEGSENQPAPQGAAPSNVFEQPPQQAPQQMTTSPTTGLGSTQPAQTAASTGPSTPTSPPSVTSPASPAPATTASPAGGVRSAVITPTTGFGNLAPAASSPAPADPAVPQQVTPEGQAVPTTGQVSMTSAPAAAVNGPTGLSVTDPASQPLDSVQNQDGGAGVVSAGGSDFEASLDEQLAKLLP